MLDRDESGAILIFSLVSVLILVMLAWTVMDSGSVARNKLETQASADVAAYSQAAVKARSMNMMAYANIAKRSVVGIHSLYHSMFFAYGIWITEKWDQCALGDDVACDEAAKNSSLYWQEFQNDNQRYRSNANNYYAADVRALDNYQLYLYGLTPWWGWSEAVIRAQRNNATIASSFPPPPGTIRNALNDPTDEIIREVGPSAGYNFTSFIDTLPVERGDYWLDLLNDGMDQSSYKFEHLINTQLHQQRSQWGAALNRNVTAGSTVFFDVGFRRSTEVFREWGRPWRIEVTHSEARWLTRTSNLVFTFQENETMFTEMRNKYRVPKQDYRFGDSVRDEEMYRPQGYWAMARSEISFVSDSHPDLWHALWTSRLRPVSLPAEYEEAGYDINAAYHNSMAFLSLSMQIGSRGTDGVGRFKNDLMWMERASRAMGQSTAEGLGK
ncbi:MAG: Tad domain-containing protein [Bradymonadaceae bacterium]|nr:Tad domain-containing protein [Lujinxingiaceae bacterium]